MSKMLLGYLYSYAYLFLVILGIGLLQKILKFSMETSRKLIHTGIVYTWVILYKYFWDSWQIVIVPITFIIINYLSYKLKIFKMMERDDNADNHMGTVYFSMGITALMIFALIWPSTIMATGIATFCLCFGDGFAGMIGHACKNKIKLLKHKTLQGTLACMVASGIGLVLFGIITGYWIPAGWIVVLGILTGLLELMEWGLDNFSILFGIYGICSLLIQKGILP